MICINSNTNCSGVFMDMASRLPFKAKQHNPKIINAE